MSPDETAYIDPWDVKMPGVFVWGARYDQAENREMPPVPERNGLGGESQPSLLFRAMQVDRSGGMGSWRVPGPGEAETLR